MNGKRVAIVQSSYIPWKGYFDLIHDVDEFIFLDEVQFTARDWRSRNKIKTVQGPIWLTVPVGNNRNRRIFEVALEDSTWQAKHWKSISHAYSRAPFFNMYREFFEHIYLGTCWRTLSEFNQATVRHIASDMLGQSTRFVDSREYAAQGARLDLIIDLLKRAGATTYVSGPSALSYLDQSRFDECGIELIIKRYDYPEHPQLYPSFVHEVSVLDLLFNTGPAAPSYIWSEKP
jgi:hypothetical protein